jgi:hypothetical protein
MTSALQTKLRATLRAHPDGLTARDAGDAVGANRVCAIQALKCMPDVYIDRYMTRPKLPPTAVWVAVPVPENCPRPRKAKPDHSANCDRASNHNH